MAQATLGEPLKDVATDGITRVRFSAHSNLLLASSWDGSVRLYEASAPGGSLRGVLPHVAPVLDCVFADETTAYAGGLDGVCTRLDLTTNGITSLGSHQDAIKCIEFIKDRGLVVTSSWDRTVQAWDPRAPAFQNRVVSMHLPGKAYTMSSSGTKLVVGTSGRQVLVFDLRRLDAGQPEQHRESSLKYQTRVLACYPDGQGYAQGSIEGRVAMEAFDTSPQGQLAKYAFKCHRLQEGGRDVVYPVNAISFHPLLGTFATGGGDGVVNTWDGLNKKRLFQISRYPSSVSSLSFSHDGALLAVASSYMYEQGDTQHPADAIYIRRMAEPEVKPKPRK